MIYEIPTHLFLQLFLGHFILQTISLRNNSTRFVKNFISFLFFEEIVKNVAWVPGEVWINCPLPSSQFFRQLIKFWMASCCFGTIKDLRRGFLLSKSPICTICPEGGFSPTCRPPFFLVRAAAAAAAAEIKSCFKSAENYGASSLWVAGHRYTRISCVSKLLWV